VGTTPEFAKFIAGNNTNCLVSGWPKNFSEMLGPKGFMFRDGPPHMTIKKIFLKQFQEEALRTKATTLETIVLENLGEWERKGSVNGREGASKVCV
jgi:cytochrome P450